MPCRLLIFFRSSVHVAWHQHVASRTQSPRFHQSIYRPSGLDKIETLGQMRATTTRTTRCYSTGNHRQHRCCFLPIRLKISTAWKYAIRRDGHHKQWWKLLALNSALSTVYSTHLDFGGFPSPPFLFPLSSFHSHPSSFEVGTLSFPFLPPPRSRLPLRLEVWGERISSPPIRSGRCPAAKRILVHLMHKFAPFWLHNDK